MSDTSIPVTPGSGTNVDGRSEDANGNFRQVVVIGDPAVNAGVAPVDPTLGLSVKVTQLPAGGIQVSNFPATQPVSGAVTISNLPAIQPVSGSISVSNLPATQPVSAAALPLPSGASTETTLAAIKAKTDNLDVLLSTRTKPADLQTVIQVPATLLQSVTGATGAAVTATLPAVAGQFHYITLLEIVKCFAAANGASATPLVVTTTNLPGPAAYTFGQPAGAIGVIDRMTHIPNSPLRSSVVNTATAIVCPATVGIIWRVNVYYYAAA